MINIRLAELRKELNLTQEELANELKITRSALSLYEIGKRDPDTDTLNQFADYFGVSVDYLLGRTTTRNFNEVKTNPRLDVSDLPEDAIRQIEEYIQFLRIKYKESSKE